MTHKHIYCFLCRNLSCCIRAFDMKKINCWNAIGCNFTHVILYKLPGWHNSTILPSKKIPYSRHSVQLLSHIELFATPWTTACKASLSINNSWSPPKLTSINSVMPFKHVILCHPILLLLSIFPSIRVFPNELALRIRWANYWSFSFSISPSNDYSGLISFRMDWLDLLADQGTLKSLLRHHSSKASIFWHSAFFIVQLSHPYMTTGKKP